MPPGTGRARALRRSQTLAEEKFWNAVRARRLVGLKFRRQVPFGRYVVDLACLEARLIVELDGASHEGRENYDQIRTEEIESAAGFLVLRFDNLEVLQGLEGVLETVVREARR